jgi:hypothetical protein
MTQTLYERIEGLKKPQTVETNDFHAFIFSSRRVSDWNAAIDAALAVVKEYEVVDGLAEAITVIEGTFVNMMLGDFPEWETILKAARIQLKRQGE